MNVVEYKVQYFPLTCNGVEMEKYNGKHFTHKKLYLSKCTQLHSSTAHFLQLINKYVIDAEGAPAHHPGYESVTYGMMFAWNRRNYLVIHVLYEAA